MNKVLPKKLHLTFTATATPILICLNKTLTFSLQDGLEGTVPTGAEPLHPAASFSWTPTEAQGAGEYTFDICVSDGDLDDCETITVTVDEINEAPILGTIGDKEIDEEAALTFTATASDADLPAQSLTFSLGGWPGRGSADRCYCHIRWSF